jgi:hypothetical protein
MQCRLFVVACIKSLIKIKATARCTFTIAAVVELFRHAYTVIRFQLMFSIKMRLHFVKQVGRERIGG